MEGTVGVEVVVDADVVEEGVVVSGIEEVVEMVGAGTVSEPEEDPGPAGDDALHDAANVRAASKGTTRCNLMKQYHRLKLTIP